MGLKVQIIKKEDQLTTRWSGGTTTQLAIYPENALYSERNFLWRISSAEVELPESIFTHLPGIKRIILPVTGELYLEHVGKYKKILKPFEQDCFYGDWITRSRGKVTDFNLMMKDCQGKVETITLLSGDSRSILLEPLKDNINYIADVFYALGEKAEFIIDNKNVFLKNKELLCIIRSGRIDNTEVFIKNISESQVNIIRTNIFY